MSAKQAETYCEVVEGQFAWFQQLCMKTAVTTVEVDGNNYGACAEHTTPPADLARGTNEEEAK